MEETWRFHVGHVSGASTVNMRAPSLPEQSENPPKKTKRVLVLQ
jgi:hypothetical protein